MQTVLVTGGAGFVGSVLVDRLLAEGRRVVVIDNLSSGQLANLDDARRDHAGQLDFHRLELTSDAIHPIIAKRRPEVVFHLAGQVSIARGIADPVRDARNNVVGTVNLLAAAVDAGVRKVVFASSAAIHGQVDRDQLPLAETAPTRPTSPIGAAKLATEHYLTSFELLHGLEWTSLAVADAYGPRQPSSGDGTVMAMVRGMLAGHDVTIPGDGEQTRDFVFVDDVVHAFALAADRGHGRRFNIGTGRQTSLNQLFRALAAATRFELEPIRVPEPPHEVRHVALSARRAAEELGWKPWTTLEEGLASTLSWAASGRR